MARHLLMLSICVLALAGCSTTKTVSTNGGVGTTPSEITRAATGKHSTILLTDGTEIPTTSLQVAADSTSYYSLKNDRFESIATNDILEVQVTHTGRGAIAGLGAGILTGAAVGLLRAIRQGDDPPGGISLSKDQKLLIFPIAHAVSLSLVSTPVGAIIGLDDTYVFETPDRLATPPSVVVRSDRSEK